MRTPSSPSACWTRRPGGRGQEGDNVNFLQAAWQEQEKEDDDKEEVEVKEGRKKKRKVNVYDFFQQMRAMQELNGLQELCAQVARCTGNLKCFACTVYIQESRISPCHLAAQVMDGGNLNVSVLLGVREVEMPGEATVMHRWPIPVLTFSSIDRFCPRITI